MSMNCLVDLKYQWRLGGYDPQTKAAVSVMSVGWSAIAHLTVLLGTEQQEQSYTYSPHILNVIYRLLLKCAVIEQQTEISTSIYFQDKSE